MKVCTSTFCLILGLWLSIKCLHRCFITLGVIVSLVYREDLRGRLELWGQARYGRIEMIGVICCDHNLVLSLVIICVHV